MKQLHENKLIVTCTLTNSAKTYVLKVLIKLCALRIRSVPNSLGNFYWAVIATVRLAAVFQQHQSLQFVVSIGDDGHTLYAFELSEYLVVENWSSNFIL